MTAYLSNVAGAPRLVNNLLVVPDGNADSKLTGTMWLTKYVSGSNAGEDNDSEENNGGGGGGGGCNALGVGLLAAALFIMKRR